MQNHSSQRLFSRPVAMMEKENDERERALTLGGSFIDGRFGVQQ